MVKPKFWEKLSSLLWPSSCICCRQPVAGDRYLCDDCEDKLADLEQRKVRRFSYNKREVKVCTLYKYEGCVSAAIKHLKFGGSSVAARPLGLALAGRVMRLRQPPFDVVCAVPMTARAVRNRGYNQAELLAKHAAQELGLTYCEGLKKIRETAEQHRLTGSDRKNNVKGAFAADAGAVAGKRVLLIDDVVTTGATLSECAVTLYRAGAAAVFCAAVASAEKS
jgi:ComF family protein